ncbi:MAG: GerAB/ArcD/ProY family transporter [Oscillospiraceae bacterium]|jgi:spore germination protein KB|nr:GerAB/ArcD/ProY family transporter [Oscillospiraceae bacterium]
MSERKFISKWQFITMTMCFLMGIILRTSMLGNVSGRDTWLIPLFGLIMFAPTVAVYCLLTRRYPGRNIYEINELIFGKAAGKVFTFLYLLFFLHVGSLNLMEMSNFSSIYLLNGTPAIVTTLMFCLISAYAIHKGVITIARAPAAFLIVTLALFAANFVQGVPQMRLEYLAPVMAQKPDVYLQAAHISYTIMYGESLVMLTFGDRLDTGRTSFTRCMLIAMPLVAVYFVVVYLRENLLLGSLTSYVRMPSFEASRMTGVSDHLQRTESIYSLLLLLYSLYSVMLNLYAALRALKVMLGTNTRAMILPLSMFAAVYGIRVLYSPEDAFHLLAGEAPFLWQFFVTVLPLAALVGSVVRRQKLPDPNF